MSVASMDRPRTFLETTFVATAACDECEYTESADHAEPRKRQDPRGWRASRRAADLGAAKPQCRADADVREYAQQALRREREHRRRQQPADGSAGKLRTS